MMLRRRPQEQQLSLCVSLLWIPKCGSFSLGNLLSMPSGPSCQLTLVELPQGQG